MASWEGRTIPDPGFGGDRGHADPALVAALAAHAASMSAATHGPAAGAAQAVLDALSDARVLVPVVAIAAEDDEPPAADDASTPARSGGVGLGATAEKTTDMAVPTLLAADGRQALPVFTSLDSLAQWRPDARPVPVSARHACLAALAEGADTLLLDPAGPVTFAVTGAPLRALAQGRAPTPPERDPEVAEVITRLAEEVAGVSSVRLAPGDAECDLRVLLRVEGEPEPVAAQVAALLAADELLRARLVRGLALAVVPGAATGESRLTV